MNSAFVEVDDTSVNVECLLDWKPEILISGDLCS
jgi:hypothetical protein